MVRVKDPSGSHLKTINQHCSTPDRFDNTQGQAVMTTFHHPLDPLTPDEITAVSLAVRHHITSQTEIKAIKFILCLLVPPPKRLVLQYLGIPIAVGEKKDVEIIRKAETDFLDIVNGCSYNAVLSFTKHAKWVVDKLIKLAEDQHPQISVEELIQAEVIVRNNAIIQRLAKEVGVEPDQIFCDGWSIGYDDRFPQKRRVQQALIFARYSEHDNLYAHPLDFIPVIDVHTGELLTIDFPPNYVRQPDGTVKLSADKTSPVPLLPNSKPESLAAPSNRGRVPPPKKSWNFLPDLIARPPTEEDEAGGPYDYAMRKELKPLHIVQPEGVSFKIDGHVLEWQGWKMHISFSQREGIALSTITYNDCGTVRPIFYRLSLAEMVVPYGAPEFPHSRKFAFDSGEYGMGIMANELSLGCDCLGQIHYLPGCFVSHDGSPFIIKNVICIHEEDNGVLWKHTDYRPNGRKQTVRRRRLVISMVCTLANYEYIWNYHFYQDGSFEAEIRLTGILSVYVSADGEPSPFGTIVAPNINAHYHQHLFNIRIDPMIDGLNNTVIESDIVSLDEPTGSKDNFAGNGFQVKDTPITTETGRPYDYAKDRRWRIVNRSRPHYASGQPAGYSIGLKSGALPLFGQPDGWVGKRAGLLQNTVWVVRDVENEAVGGGSIRMWPAGRYVPQTREEPEDSVREWVKGGQKVIDEDLLVFVTVGTTHIPRPEDWPVMPVEHLSVTFKPNSFFKANPSIDVPGSNDCLSVLAFKDPHVSGTCVQGQGGCCQSTQ